MAYCPSLLKNIKNKSASSGLTLIELLVIIATIGILAVIIATLLNPRIQLAKSRDARRKADLQKLRNPLEDYYNDNECYPETLSVLRPYYLKEIPKDPETKEEYLYVGDNCDRYWVYAKLENSQDQIITQVGCASGCGPGGRYNFGVASSNTRLEEGPTGTPTPTGSVVTATPTTGGVPTSSSTPTPTSSGTYYGCKPGLGCVLVPAGSCQPTYLSSDCYGQCAFGNECR